MEGIFFLIFIFGIVYLVSIAWYAGKPCSIQNPTIKVSDNFENVTNPRDSYNKEELLSALCGYYPYGVIVEIKGYDISKLIGIDKGTVSTERGINYPLELVKPYLRPMSSMTEEEKDELSFLFGGIAHTESIYSSYSKFSYASFGEVADWFNKRHLDYRGLLPMGLALEATDDMYNLKDV